FFSALKGDVCDCEIKVCGEKRVNFNDAIIRLRLLNYCGCCTRAGNGRVVGGDIEITNRVIARKTFGSATSNSQLISSGRNTDRSARIEIRERDCAAQATVICSRGTGRGSGNVVGSIDSNGSEEGSC